MSGGVKILLVEDDEGHAELVKLNLERRTPESRVLHFSTGQRALDFLNHDVPAHEGGKYVVILDINMPGFDGYQVLKQLKQNAILRVIPVIVFSTAENENGVSECYALGCNFYLAKPVDYADFTKAVQDMGLFVQKTKIPAISLAAA